MTDKMTLTPNHFSVESGFQSGVVVEITTSETERMVGYYVGFGRVQPIKAPSIEISPIWPIDREAGSGYEPETFFMADIKSICLLTGPMRFWAGAPGRAKACTENTTGGVTRFLWSDGIILTPHETITHRPFWCDFGKGE